MKRSTDRVLTTHAGTLPNPRELEEAASEKTADPQAYAAVLSSCVAAGVRRQAETGLDVVNDGEFGKSSWTGYATERLGGFEQRPAPEGQPGVMQVSQDRRDFPAYYEE